MHRYNYLRNYKTYLNYLIGGRGGEFQSLIPDGKKENLYESVYVMNCW